MSISVFDLFKIGIGPSSSHTVGPMKAANSFVTALQQLALLTQTARVTIELYGSLSATGPGHGTDRAAIVGLTGEQPETVDPERLHKCLDELNSSPELMLNGTHKTKFDVVNDLKMNDTALAEHPNGIRFSAFNSQNESLLERTYLSVGGGFICELGDTSVKESISASPPFPFKSAEALLAQCKSQQISISELMLINEQSWRSRGEIFTGLLQIWSIMKAVVQKGIETQGILPGGLRVKRRAPDLYKALESKSKYNMITSSLEAMDWVNLYALATNEENAAGGRIVTAPTNGAAGIIPAVLHYFERYSCPANNDQIVRFLLTSAAIGILCKENASISGAEVGCQGEVGSACAMAAAGLTEVLGGTPEQVENAAEIGLEHNLGLTCDPVAGLVQVPCIERNAVAAMKAINATQIALRGDGSHFVSLDKVIKTMKDTGADMQAKYKETSQGGLAVNVIEC
ncbi:L-serine ammonia-lyase [Motiliproteus sp. MSK22-1]|uniref:L-serine ammonia-lyase n=1 Tax=Motiliproteus sp. MSK22-1 TaxID=1897630 RepID=UPI0009780130|nr:L-serine ammonia-lyase [Motiliproteus sp. MSK22-1]OMH38821.1 L-serine ammonia-lyase [Motiliproteus sp. MSK22-1]